jgi:hypothetical protein
MSKVIKETTAQWEALIGQGSPLVQGTTVRDIFDPTAMSSNSSALNSVKPIWALVAHACNSSYSGGRVQDD